MEGEERSKEGGGEKWRKGRRAVKEAWIAVMEGVPNLDGTVTNSREKSEGLTVMLPRSEIQWSRDSARASGDGSDDGEKMDKRTISVYNMKRLCCEDALSSEGDIISSDGKWVLY